VVDRLAQTRVAVGVTAAQAGRGGDLLDQLGEQLAAGRIIGPLLALDRRPLGMAAHGSAFTKSLAPEPHDPRRVRVRFLETQATRRAGIRSEERRVGKEWRSRGSTWR